MASIIREPNGRKTIQFVWTDGSRPKIRLGKATMHTAEGFKVKIEALVTAAITGHPVDDEVARWVTDRPPVVLDRLAEVGLIPKREAATLSAFLDGYIAMRCDV